MTNNFGATLTFQPKANGTSQPSRTVSGNSEGADNPEYLRQLKLLNENILSWIQKHVTENPYCILTPSFKDYEKHLANLDRKYAVKGESTEKETPPAAAPKVPTTPPVATEKPVSSTFGVTASSLGKGFGTGAGFNFTAFSSAPASEAKPADSSSDGEKKGWKQHYHTVYLEIF